MFINLFLLFICVNFALNLVGAAGSPLAVEMDGDCHPYKPYDKLNPTDGGVPTDPTIDTGGITNNWNTEKMRPVGSYEIPGDASSGVVPPDYIIPGNAASGDHIDIHDIQGQVQHPDDSTETSEGVWTPVTGWWNSIADAASKGWAAMETMMNMVSGGYIVDIIENTSIDCSIDNRALLSTLAECSALPVPVSAPCTNPYYGEFSKPRVVSTVAQDCSDSFGKNPPEANKATAPCLMDAVNPMWDQFKQGIYVIFTVLLMVTLFYWITGRGHILSS